MHNRVSYLLPRRFFILSLPNACLCRTASCRIVARTGHFTSSNLNVQKSNVTTTSATTKHVIVSGAGRGCSNHILEQDILNNDTIRWISRWASIKVILLYVDSIGIDIGEFNVAICDVGDETGGIVISLNASSVRGIDKLAVFELENDEHLFR